MSTSNLPANLSSFVTALEQTSNRVQQEVGDMPYLRLLKSGEWVYGAEDIEAEKGSRWAINAKSLATGFAAWEPGELLGEAMALITEPSVLKADLEDVGAQWKPQVAFQLACTTGTDVGVNVLYKTTSYGGNKAFKKIVDAILARVKAGEAEHYPIVQLDMDSYKHAQYGKVYNPIFNIVDWMGAEGAPADEVDDSMDQAEAVTADEQEAPAEEKKPARRSSRRAAKESSDDEQEPVAEDKPKRRSRRRG